MQAVRIFTACLLVLVFGACAGIQESDNGLPVKCVDKPEAGPCTGRLARFWYDYGTNSCRMFYYGGCGGHVPFESREACEQLCVAKGSWGSTSPGDSEVPDQRHQDDRDETDE